MIYLDHAATAYPLSKAVQNRVTRLLSTPLGNPGRSGHPLSAAAAEVVFDTRVTLGKLVGLDRPERVILTSGATAALNLAIIGSVAALEKKGIRPVVLSDPWEHNSVLRPLFALEAEGRIRLRILTRQEMEEIPHQPPFAHLAVFTARSNVTGREWPLFDMARALHRQGTVLIADGAQRIGHAPCTFSDLGADMICAPGHKGLGGLMGAGFLAIASDSLLIPDPVLSGGSGNDTFNSHMPDHLPERLEAGTLPLIPIAAMGEGAAERQRMGLFRIDCMERERKRELLEALAGIEGIILYEPDCPVGPLSVNVRGRSPEKIAQELSRCGIYARAGFHCAPLVHRELGTEKTGTLRFSFSPTTTPWEIRCAAEQMAAFGQ